MAMTDDLGARSRAKPESLARKIGTAGETRPVTLPPGRAKLATRPLPTGSRPATNTIGMVVVAALAASAAGGV